MAEVNLRDLYSDRRYSVNRCYPVCHWYLRPYYLHYNNTERPLFSLFTHSHSEIVRYLKRRNERLPNNFISKCHMLCVYYLCGRSPIHICTIGEKI